MLKKASSLVLSKSSSELHLDVQYQSLLSEIKSRLKKAQLRAVISVNHELIQFYWGIGKLILEREKKSKWGSKLFEVLASDLRNEFPDTQGFSKTNLIFMRLFAKHYSSGQFGEALPHQLTWTHHVVLIRTIKPKNLHIKQWYAAKTVENGWSYRELYISPRCHPERSEGPASSFAAYYL